MDPALQTMINNLPEKTGKSLEEWFAVLATKTYSKHGEGMAILKGEYGVTHGFANTILSLYKSSLQTEEIDLEKDQYKGKEVLSPLYEDLKKYLNSLGSDVKVVPKKTSVSFIRKKQFVLIKPATKTRIDLGLKIKDQDPTGKLESSGPFGTMCTHRIQIKSLDDINDETRSWLEKAYNQSV